MCAKVAEPANEEDELFVEGGYEELPSEILDVDTANLESEKSITKIKANKKLMAKKRMDAYLERKWFKDQGWDDDDELFGDAYFTDDNI
jgi:hypothetical protein